jgi:predicted HNH restriction endonuclease
MYSSEGDLLNHVAGNLFEERGVSVGDTVYVVTVIKGKLYLCGKLIVGKICDVDEAATILGCEAKDLWEANEHIIARAATPLNFSIRVPLELTKQLRFVSDEDAKPLFFKSHEHLDKQTLRGVRELTPLSRGELDKLLPSLEEIYFEDNLKSSSILDEETLPEEVVELESYYEGATKQITVNIYERNAKARKDCISHYGTDCFVCGFNFKAIYGDIGGGFIHVHHLKPLSEVGEEYELDPVRDLRPVCPNCHAMIHRRVPAYTIKEIRKLLIRTWSGDNSL